MAAADDEAEFTHLSEIYEVLRADATSIVSDLEAGVKMWREAAAANLAAAGFLLLLALSTYRLYSATLSSEPGFIILAEVVLAAVLLGFATMGFRKYSALSRRYARLFQHMKELG